MTVDINSNANKFEATLLKLEKSINKMKLQNQVLESEIGKMKMIPPRGYGGLKVSKN